MDVDQNPQTAMRYQIVSIPMQMFFNNGERVDEILGAVPEHMIRSKVEEVRQRFPTDEKGMLKVILDSWIEQNRRHGRNLGDGNKRPKYISLSTLYKLTLLSASYG